MFAKLVAVVVSLGACACGLLAMRQSRLQAASELAQVQLRISKLDQELWTLRSDIATRITPQHIERMALDVGPLRPMIPGLPPITEVGANREIAVLEQSRLLPSDLASRKVSPTGSAASAKRTGSAPPRKNSSAAVASGSPPR